MPAWVHTAQVHENPMLAPDREETETPPEAKRSWSGILLILNGACLAATLAVAGMMLLAWAPLRELGEIDDRLAKLDGIEQRLRDGVENATDRVDRSIQRRIDGVDAELGGLTNGLGQLRASVGQGVELLEETSAQIDETFAGALLAITELAEQPVPGQPPLFPGQIDEADLPSSHDSMERLTPSSQFERQELPDGSVAYRRRGSP